MPSPDSPQHRILFDHIAFGVERIEDTTEFLVGVLGGASHGGGPSGDFNFWQWRYSNGGVIEVIEPDRPAGGFVHRFLERHGRAIHHVTFKVPDLEAICARARALGYRVVGYDVSIPSWKQAFLHPKEALGIVVQFAESHPELYQGPRQARKEPRSPAPAHQQAAVLGLRLAAPDLEMASRQWRELLGGEEESTADGARIFRWPGSPMFLRVERAGAPGPRAVEIAGVDEAFPRDAIEPSVGGRFLVVS